MAIFAPGPVRHRQGQGGAPGEARRQSGRSLGFLLPQSLQPQRQFQLPKCLFLKPRMASTYGTLSGVEHGGYHGLDRGHSGEAWPGA